MLLNFAPNYLKSSKVCSRLPKNSWLNEKVLYNIFSKNSNHKMISVYMQLGRYYTLGAKHLHPAWW